VTEDLARLEFEVEEARARLVRNLSVLRAAQTYRKFTADLRSEAQSVAQRVMDDVKARAAANPAAVLAISAGIAWRLLKDPPIAMALIGAGVLGLWRAKPVNVARGDYLSTAQQRFREQVGDALDTVKDYASEAAVVAQEKAADYAQTAGKAVQGLATSAAEETLEAIESARAAAASFPEEAVDAAQRATAQLGHALDDGNLRDQLLLGAAGVAVATALGLAYQRRMSDQFEEAI
jgi:hypothetical protein